MRSLSRSDICCYFRALYELFRCLKRQFSWGFTNPICFIRIRRIIVLTFIFSLETSFLLFIIETRRRHKIRLLVVLWSSQNYRRSFLSSCTGPSMVLCLLKCFKTPTRRIKWKRALVWILISSSLQLIVKFNIAWGVNWTSTILKSYLVLVHGPI